MLLHRHCNAVCGASARVSRVSKVVTRSTKPDVDAMQSSSTDCIHKLKHLVLSSCLAAALSLGGPAESRVVNDLDASIPVYDGAKIIASERREALTQKLSEFESSTGWRVRVLTYSLPDQRPDDDQLRKEWTPNKKTVVMQFDPSSPNIISVPYIGDEVLFKLKRSFFLELQSRYGNIFYVRDEGEQQAVLNSVSALTECLGREQGCAVVPGLPEDQYFFTLWVSIAGGIVAGSAYRLEPQGFVQQKWVWVLIFSPLWLTLFGSYGLGPVVTRTDDRTPVIANTVAFLAAAAFPTVISKVLNQAPPPKADV